MPTGINATIITLTNGTTANANDVLTSLNNLNTNGVANDGGAIQTSGSGDVILTSGNIKRATGHAEVGHYFIAGPAYTSGAVVSGNPQTISRTVVPASVSIDTADTAPGGGMSSTVSTAHLTSGGFQVFSSSTTSVNAFGGGNWTVNY